MESDQPGKPIRRLVLDVLKPHNPRIDQLAEELAKIGDIDSVNITRVQTDSATEGITVTIVGDNLIYKIIEKQLKINGASIHSVDEVVAGKKIISTVILPDEEKNKAKK